MHRSKFFSTLPLLSVFILVNKMTLYMYIYTIKARNYVYFVHLMGSILTGALYIIVKCTQSILRYGKLKEWPLALKIMLPSMLMWCTLVVLLVGGLLVFHMYLMCSKQTTQEFLRNRGKTHNGPHDIRNSPNVCSVERAIQNPLKKYTYFGIFACAFYESMLQVRSQHVHNFRIKPRTHSENMYYFSAYPT